jgi:hypothetical protein
MSPGRAAISRLKPPRGTIPKLEHRACAYVTRGAERHGEGLGPHGREILIGSFFWRPVGHGK